MENNTDNIWLYDSSENATPPNISLIPTSPLQENPAVDMTNYLQNLNMVQRQNSFPTPFYSPGTTSPIYEAPPSVSPESVGSGFDKNFFNFSQQQQQQQIKQQQSKQQQKEQQQQNFFQNQMLDNVQFNPITGNLCNQALLFPFNSLAGLGNSDATCSGNVLGSVYGKKQDITSTNKSYQQIDQETIKLLLLSSESLDSNIHQQKFYDNESTNTGSNPKLNRNNKKKHVSKTRQISEERYKKSSIQTVFSNLDKKSSPASTTSVDTSKSKLKENRYENTVDALKKAGLMDITLQTGELLKRSNNLQKDIDMLEEIVKVTKHLMSSE